MARKSIQHIHDKFCVTPKINEAEAEINQKAAVIDQEPEAVPTTVPTAQNSETPKHEDAAGQLEQSGESDNTLEVQTYTTLETKYGKVVYNSFIKKFATCVDDWKGFYKDKDIEQVPPVCQKASNQEIHLTDFAEMVAECSGDNSPSDCPQ